MRDEKLLDEIKNRYALDSNIKKIVTDLSHNVNLCYWANKFCSDEFGNNVELAEALFDEASQRAEDFRDYKELAFSVGKRFGLNDTDWAKELLDITIKKITNLRDLRNLADELAKKNDGFYDVKIAATLYNECISKAKSSYDYYCIADSLCDMDLLNDPAWAKEIYILAIKEVSNAEELVYIADAISDEDLLNDQDWASELYASADEFEDKENY
ncbi:MAG: hypothetical protein MJK08_10410 [Campylobacterales bacterium]|nr:hypothetical protein [Campylobacterales bacterium]